MYVFPPLGMTEDHQMDKMEGANKDTQTYDEAWLFGLEWALKCFLHIMSLVKVASLMLFEGVTLQKCQ